MIKKFNKRMHETITGWGIPDIPDLKNRKLEFVFDSSKIPNVNEHYKYLFCEYNNVKFCLYDYTNGKIIFSMHFFEGNNCISQLRKGSSNMRLELLNVNDHMLRNKGIASYYLKKFEEYVIEQDIRVVRINLNPNANIFKNQDKENSLSLNELKKFYECKFTKEIKIEFI